MATVTKIYCDGCGADVSKIEIGPPIKLAKWSGDRPPRDDEIKQYDLCSKCRSHLHEQSDPSRWPRIKILEPGERMTEVRS